MVLAVDIMRKSVITTEPADIVMDAAKKMAKNKIGSLVVVKDDKIVGIVTWRDIVTRVVAQGLDPKACKVDTIMTQPVITCSPTTPIRDIVKILHQNKINRLPVVDRDSLVGIITAYDVCLHGWGAPSP